MTSNRLTEHQVTLASELVALGRENALVYNVLTRYMRGEWTLDHALTQAVIALAAVNRDLERQVIDLIASRR